MNLSIPENETVFQAVEAMKLESDVSESLLRIARLAVENPNSDNSGDLVNVLYLLSLLQERLSARLDRCSGVFLGKETAKA